MKINFIFILLLYASTSLSINLDNITVNSNDIPSLQRGAKYYMNYCAGCHALSFIRLDSLAQLIGLRDDKGAIDKELLEKNLNFAKINFHHSVKTSMRPEDAREWFGVVPPDLTLVMRVRSPAWVYTYLKSFYRDETRPWGTNNLIFPDVAMPNVLLPLQGEQIAVFDSESNKIQYLELLKPGDISPFQFDSVLHDLVNFLSLIAEPNKHSRIHTGYWVVLFIAILLPFLYWLKKEYWKNIH